MSTSVLQDQTNALLIAIIESSDDAIVSKTLDGVIQSWNHAAEVMFGYTAAEATGRHITLIIPPELRYEEVMAASAGQEIPARGMLERLAFPSRNGNQVMEEAN